MTAGSTDELRFEVLRDLFDDLGTFGDEEHRLAYSTIELLSGRFRLGKSRHGTPALLVPTQDSPPTAARSRHYANLRILWSVPLRVEPEQETAETETFAVIECLTRESEVIEWFLRLLPDILDKAEGSTPEDFERELERIGELFRSLDTSSERALTGLWAELLLMCEATSPAHAARAWHASPEDNHDFTVNGTHLEVKCTRSPQRRHTFSLPQLEPAEHTVVASFLAESSDGPSVLDLWRRLSRLLTSDPTLQAKVQSQVMAGVGRRLSEAEETRFDADAALRSLAFVKANQIPRIASVPQGVSDVRFTSDLTASPSVDSSDAVMTSLGALLPRDR